jgi:prepilin peptidase CpaA
MHTVYFPAVVFGWLYLVLLIGLLATAAYFDLRALRIPKSLTLLILTLGIAVNVIRGIWLGADGNVVWVLGEGGAGTGTLDGLLFALAGFGFGFTLFFVLWLMGICGGGDVKLFAALGAWTGPYLLVLVLMGTVVVIFAIMVGRIVWGIVVGQGRALLSLVFPAYALPGRRPGTRARAAVLGLSLPLVLGCLLALLWALRVDLRLAEPGPAITAQAKFNSR